MNILNQYSQSPPLHIILNHFHSLHFLIHYSPTDLCSGTWCHVKFKVLPSSSRLKLSKKSLVVSNCLTINKTPYPSRPELSWTPHSASFSYFPNNHVNSNLLFPTKVPYALLPTPTNATCSAHCTLLYFTILTITHAM